MKYNKTSFRLENDSTENREILMAFIAELPFESFIDNDDTLEAYSPEGSIIDAHIQSIVSLLPFEVNFSTEAMPDVNWNEEWEKNYFKPLLINDDCLIRAPFHQEYPTAKHEIIINPNMAFGTGNHETTSLMIEHISEIDVANKSILDMGCGTGILGIFAAMKGCQNVRSIDIDEWSFESTKENCKLNNINNLNVEVGDANSLTEESAYDIVLANIHKNVITNDLPKYKTTLKPNGMVILSGFYNDDLNDIKKVAIDKLGFTQIALKEKNNWVAVVFKLS
ncbi:MAG: 50S ribosomal protein L11 methyltransferase [Mangrovibacterium sp.]